MFRPSTNEDITDEEYEKYIQPHRLTVEEYLRKILIPDYCAFFIASGYRLNTFEEETFDQYIGSALDFFNIDYTKRQNLLLKKEIIYLLKLKYGYIVKSECPMVIEYDAISFEEQDGDPND